MKDYSKIDSIRIGLASPETIESWSYGEVTKPETINYRTLKPENDGLFCQKIFGPMKKSECSCGKYKKTHTYGIVCDRCGVEITDPKVRRERMGHIKLAAPVSHIWYFKGIPSKMGILLDISPKKLERILYFAAYIVLDGGDTPLTKYQILEEADVQEYKKNYKNRFRVGMGAEAIKELLEELDLDELARELQETIETKTGSRKKKAIRRLDVVEAFRKSGNKPEWMILENIPVIPPDLRPMVQLDGGRFAASDLNDLYRKVINRNNRLKKFLEIRASQVMIKNEKRMLQEAVDALIDNGRRGRPVTGPGKRPLKSLSDMLKGKQGRFRQNLLGKRVDYSGRSVIVVGPELKFHQCGLPKKMALELFKPFVIKELIKRENNSIHNVNTAKSYIDREDPIVWDIVEDVIKEHPVLLNRAPTLHRLGIQAFEPVLVEGKAIKLHPLACTAYNADFDGDQMAVHVPLSIEAQTEAKFLMLSPNNILAPKDGKPITTPTQDMILGVYYLTFDDLEGEPFEAKNIKHVYKDYDEMILAYKNNTISVHERVGVRVRLDKEDSGKIVYSTVGRFILNDKIPQDLGFVDREVDKYSLEVDKLCGGKQLEEIIARAFEVKGNAITAKLLDDIKDLGFKYSTRAAITIAIDDMVVPPQKQELIDKAQEKVDQINSFYREGVLSNEERTEKVLDIWKHTNEEVGAALVKNLDMKNNLKIMYQSGARGSENQIRQLAGMRGLMANATGKIVEIPILSNFREGLSILEYFISTTGSRKGSADTSLRTADAGHLTRRLVDVAQDVIVVEEDCGTQEGFEVYEFSENIGGMKKVVETLEQRLYGRYPFEDIYDNNGKLLCSKDQIITETLAKKIAASGIERVKVRSVLTCKCQHGVCAKCYGLNMADGKPVSVGESVGIIAAQSIGEPGTQLTMRTFHSGGVAGEDITQGLPRVEEIFETRKPKGLAFISTIDGDVSFRDNGKRKEIVVSNENEEIATRIIYGSKVRFEEGDKVKKGDQLTDGSLYPQVILKVMGVKYVEDYIIKEIQKVYESQKVGINDKHIEIIAKQMLSKVVITDSGDTNFVTGNIEDYMRFLKVNQEMEEQGLRPAEAERIILGITKASLSNDSFLSAASFQETTRVLTDASIRGKVDKLTGLKENVIVGNKLIPAGTGIATEFASDNVPTLDENIE